jgi:hypothetical protein
MANPVINNLSASMGSFNEYPIVNLSFNLQHDEGFSADVVLPSGFQYQLLTSDPGNWHNATSHSSTPTENLGSFVSSPGRSTLLRWDVKNDANTKSENARFRMLLADPSGNLSGYVETSDFAIETVDPSASFTLDEYTNQQSITFPITPSGNVNFYKISESAGLTGAGWNAFSGNGSITFQTSTEEIKNVYVQVRDNFYNTSDIVSDSTTLHTTGPTNTFLRINGTIPENEFYTGMTIDSITGAMSPDRTARLDIFAEDLLSIEVYIDGDVEDGPNVRTWMPLSTPQDVTLLGLDYNWDEDTNVSVTFRDAALNETPISKTIRLNTRVFLCDETLLREQDASYAHQILEVTNLGTTTIINETRDLEDTFTRRWNEIFYPITHDYPRGQDGLIDEAAAVAMNQSSNASYDAVQLSAGSVLYDSELRPITVNWTNDGSKDYENLESSYQGNLRYWVIDNSGYGDIDVDFEYFYMSPNSFGPPFNNISPYNGDHLVVYDASAEGAVQETIGPTGERGYTLIDSSKLVELYAYTGEGSSVIELSSGFSVNATTNGAFSVPTIRGATRLAFILYSDASDTASGFKIKSGPKYNVVFRNWDVDERNGEVWIHKYPNGQSYSGTVRMIYDYYDTDVSVDVDTGTVTFKQDPSGVVTADYTYYVPDAYKIPEDTQRMFVATRDDFVDYLEPSVYARPSGQLINKASNYIHGYPTEVSPSGKVSANFTVDKDRGLIEFYDGTNEFGDEFAYVPKSRITIDYLAHTYKRLANDGFGNLIFRDETLVADSTPLFPDYTWVDVKIVNEGDAILEDGKLKFLSRGFDTNNDSIIDQVLDVNRPWDVQSGTAAETYDKAAMEIRNNYTWDSFATKAQCMSILSSWKNAPFGFDVYPRERFYGRVAWVLGGTSGGSYPSTSVGKKVFSAEIEGKYYNIET